jgi:uncharacterized coiled-coil protein SlyX
MKPTKTTTSLIRNSINHTPLRRGFPILLLVLGLFALSPAARAVDPPPDGGYPGNNTAEGDGALQSVTPDVSSFRGNNNTATGFHALYSSTTGYANTANGFQALTSNIGGGANTATGYNALRFNTTGASNTATGSMAL